MVRKVAYFTKRLTTRQGREGTGSDGRKRLAKKARLVAKGGGIHSSRGKNLAHAGGEDDHQKRVEYPVEEGAA